MVKCRDCKKDFEKNVGSREKLCVECWNKIKKKPKIKK